jgi:hypothetical protein
VFLGCDAYKKVFCKVIARRMLCKYHAESGWYVELKKKRKVNFFFEKTKFNQKKVKSQPF